MAQSSRLIGSMPRRRPRQRTPNVEQRVLSRLSRSYDPSVLGQITPGTSWTDQLATATQRRRKLWGMRSRGGKKTGHEWDANERLIEALSEGIGHLDELGYREPRF